MIIVFFFNDTATTEIYTLSLHDALPIYLAFGDRGKKFIQEVARFPETLLPPTIGKLWSRKGTLFQAARVGLRRVKLDRKSTRLNSSHANISYAVFCLKKKHNLINYI